MNQDKIVVVMGGPSSEASISRQTWAAVLKALQSKGCNASGMEFVPETFSADIKASGAKLVFNAMHGKFGEDGLVQAALELLGIPYTGSGVLASAVTMDKAAAKRVFLAEGISTPHSNTYQKQEMERDLAAEIRAEFSLPVVVKAATQGSSIGVVIVEQASELPAALAEAFRYSDEALVEEFIAGKELTVPVWGDAANAATLPIIEITTASGRYDYDSKYTKGASTHIIPARIPADVAARVQQMAVRIFTACGCRGVARMDMMLDRDGTPYVIDVNTVPGMTELSLVPDAARAAGVEFPDFCMRLLELAGFQQ